MAETQFAIESTWHGEILVFEVRGEMDMATSPELVSAVEAMGPGAGHVVVDLGGTTFLDSAAINGLVRVRRELDRREVPFNVVSPLDGVVRRALEITNVVDELGVVGSRDEAFV
jgi:anti-sigma B factor antagonist